VNFIKKAFGVAAVLGGTGMFACSGTNQVVGSDGLRVGGGTAGAGQGSAGAVGTAGARVSGGSAAEGNATTSGSAPAAELNYQQLQLNPHNLQDGHPVCMPMALPIDDATGNAACFVLSTRHSADCSCAAAGISPVSDELSRVTRRQMQLAGMCAPSIGRSLGGYGPCDDVCVCRVDPAVGTSLQKCLSEPEPDATTTGWCYVSDKGDAAQKALIEGCPGHDTQRLRFFGPAIEPGPDETPANPGELILLGSPLPTPVAKLGEKCISKEEYNPNFRGYDVSEVNVQDHASMCETGICLVNHFQGRASCPYGQAEAGGDCLVAGGNDSVTRVVHPQLEARQADVASICSCQCAGPGPGPYCTCPESMQCEHLIDDLQGGQPLSGSYCIPAGSQYDPQGDTTECSGESCGFGHYYQ